MVTSPRAAVTTLAAGLLVLAAFVPAQAQAETGSYPFLYASAYGVLSSTMTACGDGQSPRMLASLVFEGGALRNAEIHEVLPFPWFLDDGMDVSVSGTAAVVVGTGTHRYDTPTGGWTKAACVYSGTVAVTVAELDCAGRTLRLELAGTVAVQGSGGPSLQAATWTLMHEGVTPCYSGYAYEFEESAPGIPVADLACVYDTTFTMDVDGDGRYDMREPNLATVHLHAC